MLTYVDATSAKVELHSLSFRSWPLTVNNHLLPLPNTNLKKKQVVSQPPNEHMNGIHENNDMNQIKNNDVTGRLYGTSSVILIKRGAGSRPSTSIF